MRRWENERTDEERDRGNKKGGTEQRGNHSSVNVRSPHLEGRPNRGYDSRVCVYIYEQRPGGFYVLKETNSECGVRWCVWCRERQKRGKSSSQEKWLQAWHISDDQELCEQPHAVHPKTFRRHFDGNAHMSLQEVAVVHRANGERFYDWPVTASSGM